MAILDAALQVVAERSIANAPTAAISEVAGIAEGSLFRYFKSKDALMGELYEALRDELSRNLTDFPQQADTRTRLRHIWDRFLDMGAVRPDRLKVLAQLRASGRLFRSDEKPSFLALELMRGACEAIGSGELKALPAEYLVMVLRAQAETTVEYIHAHPECASSCRELGFKMLWKSLTGE